MRTQRKPEPALEPRFRADEAMDMSESDPVVCVLDDDPQVRKALGRLLRSAGHRVELFASAREFLEHEGGNRPGCLVSDLRMPELDGLDLFAMLRVSGQRMPIVFITGYGDVPTSVGAMKSGAVDFLTKPVDEDDLLQAVKRALQRDARTRRTATEHRQLAARFAALTPREGEVLDLVVQGLLNKQIAGRLGTSEHTIKVHRRRVMQKMGATSLAQLVHFAERLGWQGEVEDPPASPRRPRSAR